METIVKILLTDEEVKWVYDVIPNKLIMKIVPQDPTWGFIGTNLNVCYLDNSFGYFTHTMLFHYGSTIRQAILTSK